MKKIFFLFLSIICSVSFKSDNFVFKLIFQRNSITFPHNRCRMLAKFFDVNLLQSESETTLRQKSNFNGHNNNIRGRIYNDPYIKKQWYLTKDRSPYLSHKLEEIWESGITGNGVIVAILEDAIDHTHIDLRNNFNRWASYDFINNIAHITNDGGIHGNWMAGLISAVSNNNKCGVGTAPNSQFASFRIFNNSHHLYDDKVFSQAISHKNLFIDIYCNSWVPASEESAMHIPSSLVRRKIVEATRFGRYHLGSLIIFSSGNSDKIKSNCAFNAFSQIHGTLTISSLTKEGIIPSYSQSCTAITAATLSHTRGGKLLFTTGINASCAELVGHTSASTAIACGIFALLLDANYQLQLREILYLVAKTSIQYDPNAIVNKAGFSHSRYIGFGLLDAHSLIKESKNSILNTFPPLHTCQTRLSVEQRNQNTGDYYESSVYSSGCYTFSSCITSLEEVILNFSLSVKKRKHVTVFVTSPSNTRVKVIEPRDGDNSTKGFKYWCVKIMSFYGEVAIGVWKIEVYNPKQDSRLRSWRLSLYGSCTFPMINFNIHNKVATHLCRHNSTIKRYLLQRLCLVESAIEYPINLDVYSFSKIDYRDISKLNRIIERD